MEGITPGGLRDRYKCLGGELIGAIFEILPGRDKIQTGKAS